jgi:radical SAM protein with 4Fe4S-binding SPASM domain
LREDIFDLLFFAKDNGMVTRLCTNGFLIDHKAGSKLAQTGIGVINISIDGNDQIHDYLRGDGVFLKATEALKIANDFGIETTIATVVSHYNYRHLSYIVEIAKKYKVASIKFQPFSRHFLIDKSKGDSFLFSGEEAVELQILLKRVTSACGQYGIHTNPTSYLEKMPSYLANQVLDNGDSCAALWTSCPINSNGDVLPCWEFKDSGILLGNLREKKFREIWNSDLHDSIRGKIKKDHCRGCLMSCYDKIFEKKINKGLGNFYINFRTSVINFLNNFIK